MLIYYFTIGFAHEPVTKRILLKGVQQICTIKLIRVETGREDDSRSRHTVRLIEQALYPFNINVEERTFKLPPDSTSITNIVRGLSEDILRDLCESYEVVLNISGGPRALVLAAFLAAVFAKSLKPNAKLRVELIPEYAFSNSRDSIIDLTPFVDLVARGVEMLIGEVRGRESLKNVLRQMMNNQEGVTKRELAQALRIKDVTVSSYLNDLFQLGLVERCRSDERDESRRYKLSDPGAVIVSLLRLCGVL